MPRTLRWSLWLSTLAALLCVLVARPAFAHQVGLSRGEYVPRTDGLHVELTFARNELLALSPDLDADQDGVLRQAELDAAPRTITRVVADRIVVTSGGARCPATLEAAKLAEEDGTTLAITFRCAAPGASFTVDLPLLDDLPSGHRHIARGGSGSSSFERVLFRADRSFEIPRAAGAGASPAAPARAIGSFFLLGVEHILTGYDHLVFLLGLVVVGGRIRSLVTVVTAFTVAHSITLALAVFGVFAPAPRFVEPAIALSIAYVGVENFFVADASKRWRITFPFGLIHGFGFAGALQEIAMPRGEVPAALVMFNLGVEAGQLSVLAVVLPVVLLLRKRPWFARRGLQALSAGIVVLGAVWFVSRVISA